MKRRNLSLIISGLLGVIAILSGIYLMSASVTNYIAESQKTDWIVTEARITDVSAASKETANRALRFMILHINTKRTEKYIPARKAAFQASDSSETK